MKRLVITQWCHERIRQFCPGGLQRCVDATMGTGQDTLFLCSLLGQGGEILAMDVQEKALEMTRERLEKENCLDKVRLIFDGHENMDHYVEEKSVDLIMFNLGYLPGGDHAQATRPDTTIEALEKSLVLLKKGGLLSLIIYSGGDSGYEEKDRVLGWLKNVNSSRYLVLVEEFYNKPNHPPLPVFIWKLD